METVHPSYVKRSSGTWNWILGKLGFGKEVPLTTQVLGSSAIKSPWHVIEIEDDNLLVMDRRYTPAFTILFVLFSFFSLYYIFNKKYIMIWHRWICRFEIAWVIGANDGSIRETIRGFYYLKL